MEGNERGKNFFWTLDYFNFLASLASGYKAHAHQVWPS